MGTLNIGQKVSRDVSYKNGMKIKKLNSEKWSELYGLGTSYRFSTVTKNVPKSLNCKVIAINSEFSNLVIQPYAQSKEPALQRARIKPL